MTGDLLVLEDVHTYYGEAHILQGISLTVRQGEVVTIIGRNGAGKTTTLRSIMGIARPRRGRILLRGQDVTGFPTHQIARRSEEHTSELQSLAYLVCRLLLEKKKNKHRPSA